MQSHSRLDRQIANRLPTRLKRWLRRQDQLAKFLPPPPADPLPPPAPPITIEFVNWCQAHPEYPTTLLCAPQDIEIALPHTVESEIAPAFFKRRSYHVKAKTVTVLPHTKLVGKDGLVILPDGSFSAEISNGHELLQKERAYRKPLPSGTQFKPGKYFSFMMRWAQGGNYYHWLHDVLLKAYLVLDMLPADIRFIVPANLQPFQRETLELLGVSAAQCEFYDGTEMWELEEQYFSVPTTWSAYDLPAADRWLRDKIWNAYGVAPTQGHKRIYIDRKNTKARRVRNDAEVRALLLQNGFETYLLEQLSFRAQVELFSQAQVIVAPHGAGLTNVLFAPPGAGVIEFIAPPHFRGGVWCYWMLSTTLGHDYWYVWSDAVPDPPAPGHNDVIVPLDTLEQTLERVLARQTQRAAA